MNKKKPKVYIPTYKIIILCGTIITICLILLLITNIVSIKKEKETENTSISQRYEPEKNETAQDTKKTLSLDEVRGKTKTEESKTSQNKVSSEKSASQKKNESVSETKKITEPAKTTSTKKQEPVVTTTSNNKNTVINVTTTTQSETTKSKTAETSAPAKKETVTATTETKKPAEQSSTIPLKDIKKKDYNFPEAVNNPQLVFVFDDGGQNLAHLDKFLKLPFPITIAVLPKIVHSKESAERIRKSGNELILHQPMQSVNPKINPGPGAITPNMSDDEIYSTLFQNLNEIGPIAGINNHEGSAITADAEKMSLVMRFTAENSIYFLDSRTNVETKVPYVASEMGYSYYERNVFLDNTKNRSDILKEINKGITIANKNGVVIMIGHIWSADILPDILNEIYPELKQKGYTFTTVSKSRAKK